MNEGDHNSDVDFQSDAVLPFIKKIDIDHFDDLVDLCQEESNLRNISHFVYEYKSLDLCVFSFYRVYFLLENQSIFSSK